MATLKQARDKADAKLAQFWNVLRQKQEAYFQKHGKYFQLLISGGRKVDNDEEYPFHVRSPRDEKHALDIDRTWTDLVPFEIEVIDHVGADYKGFTATVMVEFKNRTFTRSATLTDRRVEKQDYDPDTKEPAGEPYLVGDEPTVQFTSWEEITIEP